MYTYECFQCGVEFQNKDKNKKFCSQRCYKEFSKLGEYKVCCWCGKKCYVPKNKLLVHKDKQFCSVECSRQYQRSRRPTRTCLHCGKHFRKKSRNNANYCSWECFKTSDQNIERLARMRKKQYGCRTNKLEEIGYSILESVGLDFEKQYIFGKRFVADAYILSTNTIVQFDGDYWHGNESVFPNLSESQKKQKEIDCRQNETAADLGMNVLRFWEMDLHNNQDMVKSKLSQLKEHKIATKD